jgi:hypothetical protein
MISKNHRQNHNFQIVYFLAGSCHTADGAYALLCDLREDRQSAVDNYHVINLKDEAKEIRAGRLIESTDPADVKEGEAELLELNNNRKKGKILYEAAVDEMNFIDKCMELLQPLRKYKNLPDSESHELMQAEEWKYEMIRRVENFMISNNGYIPPDHFETMRQHPAFKAEILPRIMELQTLLTTAGGRAEAIAQISENKSLKIIEKLLI